MTHIAHIYSLMIDPCINNNNNNNQMNIPPPTPTYIYMAYGT